MNQNQTITQKQDTVLQTESKMHSLKDNSHPQTTQIYIKQQDQQGKVLTEKDSTQQITQRLSETSTIQIVIDQKINQNNAQIRNGQRMQVHTKYTHLEQQISTAPSQFITSDPQIQKVLQSYKKDQENQQQMLQIRQSRYNTPQKQETQLLKEFNQQKTQFQQFPIQNAIGSQIQPLNIQAQQIQSKKSHKNAQKIGKTNSSQQIQVSTDPIQISIPQNDKNLLDHKIQQWILKIQKQEPLLSRYTPFASLNAPRPSANAPIPKSNSPSKIQIIPPPAKGDKKLKPWERLGLKKLSLIQNPKVQSTVIDTPASNSQIIQAASIDTTKNISLTNKKQLTSAPNTVEAGKSVNLEQNAQVLGKSFINLQTEQQLNTQKKVSLQPILANNMQTLSLDISKQKLQIQLPAVQKHSLDEPKKLEHAQISQIVKQQSNYNPLLHIRRINDKKQHQILENQIVQQKVLPQIGGNILPQFSTIIAPQVNKLHQQPSSEAELSAQNLQLLQTKPLSQKSSDSEGVIINNASFQKDSLQKIRQKSKLIEQLEIKIKQQQKLNNQLENQSSIALKLAISATVAVVTGGIVLITKKNKIGALVVGLATSVSTFLLTK